MATFDSGGVTFTQMYSKDAGLTEGCFYKVGRHPDNRYFVGCYNPGTQNWDGQPMIIDPAGYGTDQEALADAKHLWKISKA